MNKQTLIDDYKQTIERLQKECTEKTDFNIKLMERVKELEEKYNAQFAEMEEKLTAEENKNYELQDKLIIANAKHVEYIIKTNEKLKNLREKLNIANKTIGGLKVHVKEMDKLLDEMRDKINDNNINLN